MTDLIRRNLHAVEPTLLGSQDAPLRRGRVLSAGILLFQIKSGDVRVMLAHPGGPYFVKKDRGAWTIPKGVVNPGESLEAAARREFAEEVGWQPVGELMPIGEIALSSGKRVIGFALQSEESEAAVLARFAPGTFAMPWPPRSGQLAEFTEIDRVKFFSISEAASRIHPAQAGFLERLLDLTLDFPDC